MNLGPSELTFDGRPIQNYTQNPNVRFWGKLNILECRDRSSDNSYKVSKNKANDVFENFVQPPIQYDGQNISLKVYGKTPNEYFYYCYKNETI